MLEDLDIRGSIVQLDTVWQDIQTRREYPTAVGSLLGQMCAVSVLIAASLKQPGRLTFQLSGHGSVSMLVVDCTENLNLRGYAKAGQSLQSSAIQDLLGDGKLLMSLDTQDAHQPYQSHVPIEGNSIAEIFQNYLMQSEQLPTILLLTANQHRASGLLLQKLPDADRKDPDGWNRVSMLIKTIKEKDLLELGTANLLGRVFAEEAVRLFDSKRVQHNFPPDQEKIRNMLRAMGKADIAELLEKHGEIVVTDDLSNHTYCFSREEALAIFDTKSTIH